MSIEINWETLTAGPDGAALAESIRDFIHERFQAIPLPKLIRSVTVHQFDFGKIAPEIVLKDICDPLPDFYESDADDEDGDTKIDPAEESARRPRAAAEDNLPSPRSHKTAVKDDDGDTHKNGFARTQSGFDLHGRIANLPAPGLIRATSNLGYFQHLSAGLSGTQTPLAAVAGAHFQPMTPAAPGQGHHHHSESFSSISSRPSDTPTSLREHSQYDGSQSRHAEAVVDEDEDKQSDDRPPGPRLESSPDDVQVVFHVTYAGDVQLSLTADVFLDYPMPSFVGIPLKLRITGLTFNGVGIVAYIKRRAHLCFLSPEDAEALIGGETLEGFEHSADSSAGGGGAAEGDAPPPRTGKVGALLEDIRIESEMGETDTGKQVLKNVGKIEKFILEQVQRIFEDEFVYPSFWTFLV